MKVKVGDICQKFQARLVGDPEFEISSIGDPRSAQRETACFVSNPAYLQTVKLSPAVFWVLTEDFFEKLDGDIKTKKIFAITSEPYLFFVKMAGVFFPPEHPTPLRHPLSDIHQEAKVHPSAQVEAFVTIEKDAVVEENVILKSGCFIGEKAQVGAGSLLHSGVKILRDCMVGKRNILNANAVIGSDGFGFLKSNGQQVKIPQVGRVILKDDVEIGACTSVDRGTFDDTVIGNGVKIDNQVQIGHNCVIGDNTIICAQAGISGNTQIGSQVLISGMVGTKGHLKIGNNVSVGGQSGVSKDIPDNSEVKGYPAIPLKEFLKTQVLYLKLPEIYKRLLNLERHLLKDKKHDEH